METRFEFLKQLDKDLRGAAARERLQIEETERRNLAGGAQPTVPFGSGRPPFGRRRGASPAPRRKIWAMVAAASIAVLMLAGAVGFVATGGSPFASFDRATSPASTAATGPTGVAGGERFSHTAAAIGGEGVAADDQLQVGYLQGILDETNALTGRAAPVPEASPAPADEPRVAGFGATQPDGQQDISKIVRDGRIGIVVKDGEFQATREAITQIADNNGGFVLASSTEGRRGTFVLRVNDNRFEDALKALTDLGTRVEFEDQTGQDVTAEFIDLQARQEILLARKDVLLGFLRRANTVQETLSLYNQVEDVQLQLEQIQGNLRFIHNQVTQATIRVQVREEAVKVQTFQEIDKPSLGQAWERAIQGSLNIVAAVVVGLGYLVPVAAIGIVAFVGWRLMRRRSAS